MKRIIIVTVTAVAMMLLAAGCVSKGQFSLAEFSNMNANQIQACNEETAPIYACQSTNEVAAVAATKGFSWTDLPAILQALGSFRIRVLSVQWNIKEKK